MFTRRARRFYIDNKALVSGVAGALAVIVTLRLVDTVDWTGRARVQRQAATSFNASATAAAGGAFDPVHCGSTGPNAWHLRYAELHRRILAGEAPQHYAVAHGFEGLADSIVGAVTVFWFALLTDRAFQMMPTNWFGKKLKYEWMYAQPFIDWTPTEADDPDSLSLQLDPNNPVANEHKDYLKCGNLSLIGADKRTIRIVTNLGYSVGLFDNPFYRDQLFAMGLRPETAFGCAYDFLLYPQPKLFEEHQHEYQQLQQPGPLKIGIQIRTGDRKMGDGTLKLKDYKHFFDCAAQLEGDYRRHGQDIVWFLITDSSLIRREARLEYGDKVLASDPNVTATHFLHETGNTPSLRAAAMDQWLFGLADFHVISRYSGYGRTGGWRSRKWHGIFTLDNHVHAPRDCSAAAWDSVKGLAALGDGIRLGAWHPGI